MDVIPLLLPHRPDKSTPITAAKTTPMAAKKTSLMVATKTNNNKSGQQDTTMTITSTMVEGCNVKFAAGATTTDQVTGAPGQAPVSVSTYTTAEKELVTAKPFQFQPRNNKQAPHNGNQFNNICRNQWVNQFGNQFQQQGQPMFGNQWGNQFGNQFGNQANNYFGNEGQLMFGISSNNNRYSTTNSNHGIVNSNTITMD